MSELLRVVSVSLGSSSRDHVAEAEILGRRFSIERRGTDGDFQRALQLIRELDGQVAAIGLGGIDLYLMAGARRYKIRDAARLAYQAKSTPVVDGSGVKDTLERQTIQYLQREKVIDFRGARVLMTCAVDRFGMAEELTRAGAHCTFGDFYFILKWPIPLRQLRHVRRLASFILPVACRLPFQILYPTGEKQTKFLDSPMHHALIEDHEILAGDFLLLRRYLPKNLSGKTIIASTITIRDIELLKERRLNTLITTTPEFDGRSFGANVMEGVFAALGAKSPKEYSALLKELNWKPRVVKF